MSPAPGPPSDPVDRRARHREVPGPLEARWVPALLVCLTLGILGVAWDAPARSAAALTGLAVAAAAVLGAARSTGRIRGVATAAALAGVAAALMLQHSAGPAAAAEDPIAVRLAKADVARGEKAYGIIVEYMAMNAAKDGSPVAFSWPAQGVSAITQPVAILKGTDNEDAAKAFVDWQLSRAAQEQSVAQGYFPILDGMAAPEGYPAPATLKILPLDAARLMADDQANKEKFADLFGG